jgi:hypothetical protein
VFLEDHCKPFPSTLRYSQLSLTFRFPHQNSLCFLLSPVRATQPAHFNPLTIRHKQYKSQPPHNMPQAIQITTPSQYATSSTNHNSCPACPLFLPLAPNIFLRYSCNMLMRSVWESWQHGRPITNCSTALSSSQPLGERFV